MVILLVILHVVICLTLIAVILLQAGRGQGLAGSSLASTSVQSLLGTRASDFLTKATTISAILFLFTCIGLDILETQRSRSVFETKRPAGVPLDAQQIQKILEKIKAGETVMPAPEAAEKKGSETKQVPAGEKPKAVAQEKKA